MSRWVAIFIAAVLLIAAVAFGIGMANADLIRIATASVSHSICDAVFTSHLDPNVVYAQEDLAEPGMSSIEWGLRYHIDQPLREVHTTMLGGFSARAVYRDGLGCFLAQGNEPVPDRDGKTLPRVAPPAEPPLVTPTSAGLLKALDLAFAEPNKDHPRWTKAMVVLHDGQIIAERYAPGYGPDTPIWGHSMTKSVMNALIGILVREGKLSKEQTIPDWQTTHDARRSVTVDQLLRMSSGLPFDETGSPADPSVHMWFRERDMAGYSEQAKLQYAPGTHWGYSNFSFMILARLVRDSAGGTARGAAQFIQAELLDPLHMSTAVFDYDLTGTPLGAGGMYASARDWARFGQLYLDDGVSDGRRILPEGWVSYSASQTLDTGYGAGFWINLVNEGSVPYWDAPWGIPEAPKDMFYARGYLGQYTVIVPSENLVVVRMGYTHGGGTGIGRVLAQIISALHGG